MKAYDPAKHELLVLKWFLDLNANDSEFRNLFAEPLRHLTEILTWAKHTVKVFFEVDANGIWIATWVEPCMSGAYWGVWCRKDKRHTKACLAHIDESLDFALQHFKVLMAATKQPRLRSEMERLGFVHQGEIPFLFDGEPAGVYFLTQETRDVRFQRRRRKERKHQHDQQPLRTAVGEPRHPTLQAGGTGLQAPDSANGGSPEHGRSERPNPDHQSKRGRRKRRGIDLAGINEASPSPSGSGG